MTFDRIFWRARDYINNFVQLFIIKNNNWIVDKKI